jgi:hypothetical protein
MAKITGRIEVLVNGTMLLNKAGAVASGLGLSGVPAFERKEVLGDTGLHGVVETPVVAKCEVTITDRDDIKLNSLAVINGNGTVIFRSAGGGKAYTITGAYCTMNFSLTGGEGETKVVFIGPYWTESTQ